MTEPVSGTTSAAMAVGGVTIVGLLSRIDPGVLIGAFAGSLIFVLSASEYSRLGRVVLFFASLLAGIVAAPFVASVITVMTPSGIRAEGPIGALVSSAIAVRLLMALSSNPKSIAGRFWSGGSDGRSK